MSGENAVKNGLNFETKVYSILKSLPDVIVTRNIPYPSIYSAFGKVPFTHYTRMEFRAYGLTLTYPTLDAFGNECTKTNKFSTVNIECKYQECSGTVDEKYPLVYQNAMISDAETTLFIYGNPKDNIKKGALNYIHEMALRSGGRLIVMEYDVFIKSVGISYLLHRFDLPFDLNQPIEVDLAPQYVELIYEYENLGKIARQRFTNALQHIDFKNLYEKLLLVQRELSVLHSIKGCRESGEKIAKLHGIHERLEKGIEEYNQELLDF